MNGVACAPLVALLSFPAGALAQVASGPTAADLAGAWSGTVTHDGESTPFGLEIVPEADGKVLLKATRSRATGSRSRRSLSGTTPRRGR